jgi:hypothetical protein
VVNVPDILGIASYAGAKMDPQRLLGRLFRRNKPAAKPMPPKTEAEKARELEQLIQAGVATHKPPTGPG